MIVDPLEQPTGSVLVSLYPCVMSCCEVCSVEHAGTVDEDLELDHVVAYDTGIRGSAGGVFIEEIPDHLLFEHLTIVEHVVGNFELVAHIPGVVDIIE